MGHVSWDGSPWSVGSCNTDLAAPQQGRKRMTSCPSASSVSFSFVALVVLDVLEFSFEVGFYSDYIRQKGNTVPMQARAIFF